MRLRPVESKIQRHLPAEPASAAHSLQKRRLSQAVKARHLEEVILQIEKLKTLQDVELNDNGSSANKEGRFHML